MGALAAPALEQFFWAAPGLGAWCNDNRLAVSGCEELGSSLLATGFAYDRHTRLDNNYAEFCWFTHRSRGVRRAGAAALDLAYVAAGRLDGYWERGLSPGTSPPEWRWWSRPAASSAATTAAPWSWAKAA